MAMSGAIKTFTLILNPARAIAVFVSLRAKNGARKYMTDIKDRINHPQHYGGDTVYEAIKVIEAWGLGFNLGNSVKYISRAGKKDPTKELEDLEKAAWYLKRHIQSLRASTK